MSEKIKPLHEYEGTAYDESAHKFYVRYLSEATDHSNDPNAEWAIRIAIDDQRKGDVHLFPSPPTEEDET